MPGTKSQRPVILIKNRWVAQVFVIIFGFVFFASAVFTGYLSYQQIFLFPRWEPVEAALIDYYVWGRRGGRSVSYQYVYGGQTYQGYSGVDWRRRSLVSELQFDLNKKTVKIRVNPNNPIESGVLRSFVTSLVWTLLIGPFSLFLLWKSKDVMTPEEAEKYFKARGMS